MKKTIISILILGIVASIVGYFLITRKNPSPTETPVATEGWVTYTNEKYGFAIDHPKDWIVSENDSTLDPKFNIYKKTTTAKPPFTHHNDLANVSIFPHGVATEGVLGSIGTSTVKIAEPINRAIDYILQNGDHWATLVSFEDIPAGWKEYGFVWARATVNNHIQKCTLDGVEVVVDRCHALGEPGAVLTDAGNVNQEERAIEEKILGSFRFIKN